MNSEDSVFPYSVGTSFHFGEKAVGHSFHSWTGRIVEVDTAAKRVRSEYRNNAGQKVGAHQSDWCSISMWLRNIESGWWIIDDMSQVTLSDWVAQYEVGDVD